MSTKRKGRKAAHAGRLLDSIGEMRANGDSCDFKVKVGSSVFDVHRMVLSACSPYFRAMLSHNMKESLEGEVKMKEVSAEAIGTCIQFMYSGEVDLTMPAVNGVLHAASLIQLDLLSTVCQDYLEENVAVENVLCVRDLAHLHGFEDLQTVCTTFIQKDLESISHTDQFCNLSMDDISEFIATLEVDKALLWVSILKWLRYDAENRKEKLPKILQLFCQNNDDLNTLILSSWKCEEVQESKTCRDIIRDRLIQNIDALRACIDADTCIEMKEILKECDREEILDLNHAIDMFMIVNFDEVSTKVDFVNLDYYNLVMLLRAKDLGCSSEKLKWDAMIRWTKHENHRKKRFPDLLRLLDFDSMAIDFIQSNIRNETLVRESSASMGIVMDILVLKAQLGVAETEKTDENAKEEPYASKVEKKNAAERVGFAKETTGRSSAMASIDKNAGKEGRRILREEHTMKPEDPEINPQNLTNLSSQQLARELSVQSDEISDVGEEELLRSDISDVGHDETLFDCEPGQEIDNHAEHPLSQHRRPADFHSPQRQLRPRHPAPRRSSNSRHPPHRGHPPPHRGHPPPHRGHPPPHRGHPSPHRGHPPPHRGYAPPHRGHPPPQQGLPPSLQHGHPMPHRLPPPQQNLVKPKARQACSNRPSSKQNVRKGNSGASRRSTYPHEDET